MVTNLWFHPLRKDISKVSRGNKFPYFLTSFYHVSYKKPYKNLVFFVCLPSLGEEPFSCVGEGIRASLQAAVSHAIAVGFLRNGAVSKRWLCKMDA